MGNKSSSLDFKRLKVGDQIDINTKTAGWVVGEVSGVKKQRDGLGITRRRDLVVEVIENYEPTQYLINIDTEEVKYIAPVGTKSFAGSHDGPLPESYPPPVETSPTLMPIPDSFYDSNFAIGEDIDVLDYYNGEKTGSPMQCWEPCQIVGMKEGSMKIRFLKWGESHDSWIPQSDWRVRLAPACSRSVDAKPIPRAPAADAVPAPTGSGTSTPLATTPAVTADLGRLMLVAIGDGKKLNIELGSHVDAFDRITQRWHRACVVNHEQHRSTGEISHVEVQYANGFQDWIALRKGYLAEAGSQSEKKYHDYTAGQFVDVEDFYRSKFTGEMESKWRMCEILRTTNSHIFVHFVGWSHRYDMDIDMRKNSGRVAPQGSKTEDTTEARAKKEKEEMFYTIMESKGLHITDMEKDGNCLFRAVAHQIYDDPERYDFVRQSVVDYMSEEKSMFEVMCADAGQDFDSYLASMRQDKKWGGNPEQLAIEELYDRPLEIYSNIKFEDSEEIAPMHIHFAGDLPTDALAGVEPLRLSYHGNAHYNSVSGTAVRFPLPKRESHVIRDNRKARFSSAATLEAASRRHLVSEMRSAEAALVRRQSRHLSSADLEQKDMEEDGPLRSSSGSAAGAGGGTATTGRGDSGGGGGGGAGSPTARASESIGPGGLPSARRGSSATGAGLLPTTPGSGSRRGFTDESPSSSPGLSTPLRRSSSQLSTGSATASAARASSLRRQRSRSGSQTGGLTPSASP